MAYSIISLIVAALLGLIPANIAKKKGHSFGLWWFYGWMLFIVAIIHVQFIKDLNAPENYSGSGSSYGGNVDRGTASSGVGNGAYSDAADTYNRHLDNSYNNAPSYPVTPPPANVYATPAPANIYPPVQRPVVYATGRQPTRNKVYLEAGHVLVGRGPDCGILYPDGTPGVSRKHCTIDWDAASGQFIVTDLGSSYGTFTDGGQQMTANMSYRLLPGTEIRIGDKGNTLRLAVE